VSQIFSCLGLIPMNMLNLSSTEQKMGGINEN